MSEDAWNKTMVEPFWKELSKYAPFSVDYMKPVCSMDLNQAKNQLRLLDTVDWNSYYGIFEDISEKLPKDDEDVINIAIYPSMTEMPEGIYGTGVCGKIIGSVNRVEKD